MGDYNANTVREMAEDNDISTVGKNGKKLAKDKLLFKMKAEFFIEEQVLASYRLLNDPEQAIVNHLLLPGGQSTKRVF